MEYPESGSFPKRVVSLVPSISESMITLGLGKYLRGITAYCPFPEGQSAPERVGGPKNADTAAIIRLQPDLVIANREENTKEIVDMLKQEGISVWVTFPRTVRESLADLVILAQAYADPGALQSIVWLEKAVDWMEHSKTNSPVRVFCPIWQEGEPSSPSGWMTFNSDTYASNLLELCGALNVFAGITGSRYPAISLDDIRHSSPEWILLPDEPFPFGLEHADWFRSNLKGTPAAENGQIILFDGRQLFWHGTRLGESIRKIPDLFHDFSNPT